MTILVHGVPRKKHFGTGGVKNNTGDKKNWYRGKKQPILLGVVLRKEQYRGVKWAKKNGIWGQNPRKIDFGTDLLTKQFHLKKKSFS